jgi:hypothetical protein
MMFSATAYESRRTFIGRAPGSAFIGLKWRLVDDKPTGAFLVTADVRYILVERVSTLDAKRQREVRGRKPRCALVRPWTGQARGWRRAVVDGSRNIGVLEPRSNEELVERGCAASAAHTHKAGDQDTGSFQAGVRQAVRKCDVFRRGHEKVSVVSSRSTLSPTASAGRIGSTGTGTVRWTAVAPAERGRATSRPRRCVEQCGHRGSLPTPREIPHPCHGSDAGSGVKAPVPRGTADALLSPDGATNRRLGLPCPEPPSLLSMTQL